MTIRTGRHHLPTKKEESVTLPLTPGIPKNGPSGRIFDVDIVSFSGHSAFLNMVLKLKPVDIDQDYYRKFQVINGATNNDWLKSEFDPSIYPKVEGHFSGSESKLQQAIDSIKGETTTLGTVFDVIVKAALTTS
jgi:hypothetical protein